MPNNLTFCPNCGTQQLKSDARFCHHCGAPIPQKSLRPRRLSLFWLGPLALVILVVSGVLIWTIIRGGDIPGRGKEQLTAIVPSPTATQTQTPKPPGCIVFDATWDGPREIYRMQPDGSRVQRLTFTSAENGNPVCSPDGRLIAFTSDRNGVLQAFVMDADGSNQRPLDNRGLKELHPSWAPDSQSIAYAVSAEYAWNPRIEVLSLEGGSTSLASGTFPSWSPDGRLIAYETGQISLMSATGSFLGNLTDVPSWNGQPAWSPDGSQIAFVSTRDGAQRIYVMNADGGNVRRITSGPGLDARPFWSPDGDIIVFGSNRTGNFEIYAMGMDGSNVRRLTNKATSSAWASWPAWCMCR